MTRSPVNDEGEHPTNEVLSRHLRGAMPLWLTFEALLQTDYPEFTSQWSYYTDVGHWFLRVTRGKQTVCWVSALDDAFKVTAYFSKRRDCLVASEPMPAALRSLFMAVDERKRNWDVSIVATDDTHLDLLGDLLRLKGLALSPSGVRTRRVGGHNVPEDAWISQRVTVAPSPYKGDGLFAAEPIAAGEAVIIWGGPSYTDHQGAEAARVRGLGVMQWDIDLFSCETDELEDAFRINHSCDPNVWLHDPFTLTARSAIALGEELAMDYATLGGTDDSTVDWDCRCGSSDCRSRITAWDWRIPALQEEYEGHFTPWIARHIATGSI